MFELDESSLTYGKKSELYVIEFNGVNVGNFFISQVEKYVFAFMIIGLQVDSDFLDEVVRPKLLALAEDA